MEETKINRPDAPMRRRRGERGKGKDIHYVVKNVYNGEEKHFHTMSDIHKCYGISMSSINRKVRNQHGKSYSHLDIKYIKDIDSSSSDDE